jgi:gluconolactonase
MKKIWIISYLAAIPFFANAQYATIGKIHRISPELDAVLDTTAKIEVIAQGFKWSEGPVWVAKGGFLLFTDVPNNKIHQWSASKGLSLFLDKAGYDEAVEYSSEPGANGLIINKKGHLVACEHGNRRVSEMPLNKPKKKKTVAHLLDGKKLNSPNDVVQARSGDYYFTDPPYGLPKRGADEPAKELPFQGVYRIDKKGRLSVQNKDISRPNGLALNPDQRILYVASSDDREPYIYAFPVKSDGNLGEKSIFYAAGGSDGLKVDKKGNLYVTSRVPKGAQTGDVLIINPSGKMIGRIDLGGRLTSNVAFGEDGRTLFITCTDKVLRVRLKASGF